MKIYYILKNDLDDKIVGKDYPQVDCLTMHQAHLITSWHLFDPKPNLKFKLKKRAVLTDTLKDSTIGGGTGFLINSKTKDIFKKFNIMRHQYFDASVETQKAEILAYFWLHLTEPQLTEELDFKNSIFLEKKWATIKGTIQLEFYEHYKELKAKDTEASFGARLDKIALSDNFDRDLDMFTFLPFDNNVYISERLKNAIEENGITGFKIEKAEFR